MIKPGKKGVCKTRENRDGKLYTVIYGEVVSMAIDPIEKKPLFNFWPGSLAFSIANPGCNMKCRNCQNWSISQVAPEDAATTYYDPEVIVEKAKESGCRSIAYTYTEPIIWFEYVLDTARIARREGIFNILVTNGFITLEALNILAPLIDAANVDLKSFSDSFYRKNCGAMLEPVLEATKFMKKKGIFLEITNLIIPGYNDNETETKQLARWIKGNLGPDTPLHFSRFYPHYRMTHVAPTPIRTLTRARRIAMEEGMYYVYVGNVPGHEAENTYCQKCGEPLVRRFGYEIGDYKVKEDGTCPICKAKIGIVGRYEATGRKAWFL